MLSFLLDDENFPFPSATDTHQKTSRTLFEAISTGAALHRESMTAAQAVSHLSLNAVERTTGTDVSDAHETLDDQFDTMVAASDDAEDRVLDTFLSTSQLSAEYAEFLDRSAKRICLTDDTSSE